MRELIRSTLDAYLLLLHLVIAACLLSTIISQSWEFTSTIVSPLGNTAFGSSIAISPDESKLIIGRDGSSPEKVFYYSKAGGGWVLSAELTFTASFTISFGISIAVTNDRLAVGSSTGRVTENIHQYTFDPNTEQWVKGTSLAADNAADRLGGSLAMDSTMLVAGAQYMNCGTASFNCGGAYIYSISNSWWVKRSKITFSTAEAIFGTFVALGPRRLLISAADQPKGDPTVGTSYVRNMGYVYSWTRSSQNALSSLSTFNAFEEPGVGQYAGFGTSVALISDNFAAVGCDGDYPVYLYTASSLASNTWKKLTTTTTPATAITIARPTGLTKFGVSLSFSSPYLLVGSKGRAFIYTFSGTSPSLIIELTSSGVSDIVNFGLDVAISGKSAIVATTSSVNANFDTVCTFDFRFSYDTPDDSKSLKIDSDSPSNNLGNQATFFKDVVVASAPACLDPTKPSSCDGGYLQTFKKDTSGAWLNSKRAVNPYRNADNKFGSRVEVAGDYLITPTFNSNFLDKNILEVSFFKWNATRDSIVRDSVIQIPRLLGQKDLGTPITCVADIAAIGMPEFDLVSTTTPTTVLSEAGCVQVFRKLTNNKWGNRTVITSSSPAQGERFGHSASLLDGTRIAISNNPTTTANQAVYIYDYTISGNTWSQRQKITDATSSGFGWKVAFLNNLLYISAVNDTSNAGSIRVYSFDSTKTPPYVASYTLKPRKSVTGEKFGYNFSTDGTRLVVGARPCDNGATCNIKGAVYTFTMNSSNQWVQQFRFESSVTNGSDGYGSDVSVKGDTVLVSAPFETVAPTRKGATYLLRK